MIFKSNNQANSRLVSRYIDRKEYGKAQSLLDSLPPEPFFDRRQLQATLYIRQDKWVDAAKLMEAGLLGDVTRIQTTLMTLIEIAQKEGRDQDALYLIDIAVRLTELLNQSEFTIQIWRYQKAVINKEADNLLDTLQTLLPGLMRPWENKISSLYYHLPQGEVSKDFGKTILATILKDMEDEHIHDLDFIKENPKFRALIEEYKEKLA